MVGGMTYRTGMTYRHTHQHTDTHMFGGRGVRRNTTRGGALATGGGDAGGTRAMSDSVEAGKRLKWNLEQRLGWCHPDGETDGRSELDGFTE